MTRIPSFPPQQWPGKAGGALIAAASALVFAFLDLLDVALCFLFRFLDGILEDDPDPCYCHRRGEQGSSDGNGGEEGGEEEVSETLYRRRNLFRDMGFLRSRGRRGGGRRRGGVRPPRWSDCGCESCAEWQGKGEEKLHFVVMEPPQEISEDYRKNSIESVIFIHGFLSSSSIWVETVFPNLSEAARLNHRMFAVDLLGFGRSPKPVDCLYRLKEHLEMIERSILRPFQLGSFHLVAHSMGCTIALALAAKYPESVKTITLIAPPYFALTDVNASHTALNRLAEKKIWPPLLFGSSVMSWYEHLGRTICFIICRNHLKWEWIMKLLSGRRDLHYMIRDITKHTHHSAWHTMHNVICGGARLLDRYLEVVKRAGISVKIIQGDKDQVVPVQCSYNMKLKLPHAKLQIITDADHNTVILGREKDFTRDLEEIWFSSAKYKNRIDLLT